MQAEFLPMPSCPHADQPVTEEESWMSEKLILNPSVEHSRFIKNACFALIPTAPQFTALESLCFIFYYRFHWFVHNPKGKLPNLG